MKKLFSLILVICSLLGGNAYADERCTEERKQWIEFYKQDFAKNFNKIEYESDLCLVSIISQEYKGNVESLLIGTKENSTQNILNNLSDKRNINWVPEYFEIDANEDYVYGAHYFYKNEYENAAIFLADFIDNNSQHRLVPKAKFLYAETFRLTDEYIDAAFEYVDIYEKFNKSEFRPISLLRIGEMTIKIGFKEKGCEVLNHFQYEFPLIKEEIYVESENLLKQYQCTKTVITDSEILLSKIIKETRELIE
jgi:TolA-binding protein